MEYLADATDFTDLPKREPTQAYTEECPVCHGHGRWNLRRDEYGPGKHFQAFCRQCWGWGWVKPGLDATCVHDFKAVAPDQPFRCWHTIACTKCGTKRSYSSDD